ncbi:GDSL-type esterase/lipase family protein [Sphingomonas panacisoli]|nr:GDSL-type esterase/lipase family protein [Sphingomonas panacisoli]
MALALLLALAAATENPCPAAIPIPPAIEDWRRKTYAPDNVKSIPPPMAEGAPYIKAYTEARKTDWADTCRYRDENAALMTQPAAARDVVFMGDSITWGWRYCNTAFDTGGGWVDRGISGQTTAQMLVRFPGDVLALKPRVVHIMAGTNDIAGNSGPMTLGGIEANIAAMVTLAKAAGIRVVLAAVPPAKTFSWQPKLEPAPRIAALNARLRALAVREKITFVDYGAVLAMPDGAMKDALTLDGVHPNAAGYAAIGPMAKKAVAAARK